MRLSSVGTALALGSLLLARPALAGPKDAQAKKALKQALETDYLETRFDDAEKRLRAAITACGKDGCAPAILAKLHAAVGTVLAGGKKELSDASDAFVDALSLDPSVEPDPDTQSSEVTFAFEQARKKLKIGAGAKAEPKDKPAANDKGDKGDKGDKPACGSDRPCESGLECVAGACEKPKSEPLPGSKPMYKNWVSAAFVPDVSLVSGTDVCTPDGQTEQRFVCLRPDGSHYRGTPTIGNADNVNTGLALATMRVMLGYDRLVIDNLTVGARIGFAFNGAPSPAKFIPVHAEVRLGYWPGKRPFEGAGVRPVVFVSGGVAQVDTKVDVEVLEDGKACGAANPGDPESPCTRSASRDGVIEKRKQTLAVYKQAGLGFASLGFAVAFAPSARVALHVGGRLSLTFPVFSFVMSPEAGIGIGF